jgi:hypothetical protein
MVYVAAPPRWCQDAANASLRNSRGLFPLIVFKAFVTIPRLLVTCLKQKTAVEKKSVAVA